MGKNKVIQFSLTTLTAVTTVFMIGMAVLRPGFENWQVAAAIMATAVFAGAIFGAAFQKSRHWGYWVALAVVIAPLGVSAKPEPPHLSLLAINTVGSYGHLFLVAVFGFGVAVLMRHLQNRYLSPSAVS